MSLDFQQVRQQVRDLGHSAAERARQTLSLRDLAASLLDRDDQELAQLRQKVELVVQLYDSSLRCALPVKERLDAHFALPGLPDQVSLLAADGSQIAPDRHAQVDFGLINVGAIQMRHGLPQPPILTTRSELFYDDTLDTLTDAILALRRDLWERTLLVELAEKLPPPVVTFTDGQMEIGLFGKGDPAALSEFQKSQKEYLETLSALCSLNAVTAGYVDKPASNLVVRLLEVGLLPEQELVGIKKAHPLRGVTDIDLFRRILPPGERSALFELQSPFAGVYQDHLALHFFYLNVGRVGHPWLARVETPAWVARNSEMVNMLHAALVSQCRIMGSRPYPYLLHRAHEAAVVSFQERDQVSQMIVLELHKRGVFVGEASSKQFSKDLPGRTSYEA